MPINQTITITLSLLYKYTVGLVQSLTADLLAFSRRLVWVSFAAWLALLACTLRSESILQSILPPWLFHAAWCMYADACTNAHVGTQPTRVLDIMANSKYFTYEYSLAAYIWNTIRVIIHMWNIIYSVYIQTYTCCTCLIQVVTLVYIFWHTRSPLMRWHSLSVGFYSQYIYVYIYY